eukprot:gene1728-biopygen4800
MLNRNIFLVDLIFDWPGLVDGWGNCISKRTVVGEDRHPAARFVQTVELVDRSAEDAEAAVEAAAHLDVGPLAAEHEADPRGRRLPGERDFRLPSDPRRLLKEPRARGADDDDAVPPGGVVRVLRVEQHPLRVGAVEGREVALDVAPVAQRGGEGDDRAVPDRLLRRAEERRFAAPLLLGRGGGRPDFGAAVGDGVFAAPLDPGLRRRVALREALQPVDELREVGRAAALDGDADHRRHAVLHLAHRVRVGALGVCDRRGLHDEPVDADETDEVPRRDVLDRLLL